MDVSQVLEEHKRRFKSVQVDKLIPLDYDLGLLAAFDSNMLEEAKFKAGSKQLDEYLKELSCDNIQLLMNQIMDLPIEATDDGVMARLPAPTTILPREKPVPKEKPMTRWEKFAKMKGIKKQKKMRMVYDESTGEYRLRWGYKGVNNDDQEPWLIELGGNDNPMEDQYSKRREEKKERVEKNKRRQQRNLEEATVAENKKSANPRDMRKQEIQKRLAQTKLSTASMGKFDAKLEGEPKLKSAKRKHTPNVGDTGEEKERAKRLLQQVNRADESSKNLVNIRKAQRNINNENAKKSKAQRSTNNENAKKNKARGKK